MRVNALDVDRGEEAQAIGLVDVLVPQAELRTAALALASEIAQSAPIAVVAEFDFGAVAM